VGFGFGKPFKEELAGEGAACAFTTASSCLFLPPALLFFHAVSARRKRSQGQEE